MAQAPILTIFIPVGDIININPGFNIDLLNSLGSNS